MGFFEKYSKERKRDFSGDFNRDSSIAKITVTHVTLPIYLWGSKNVKQITKFYNLVVCGMKNLLIKNNPTLLNKNYINLLLQLFLYGR